MATMPTPMILIRIEDYKKNMIFNQYITMMESDIL